MSKPIRVLHWGMLGGLGGIEIFIMNVYRKIDKNKVQFDFLTTHDGQIAFEDEITRLGGRIYRVVYSKQQSLVKHYTSLEEFFKNNAQRYQAIHMHMNNINFIRPLKLAKKYDIPVRIFHSHNAGNMHMNYSKVQLIQEVINRKIIDRYATDLLACSNLAGKYMFQDKNFLVLNNGIETENFLFNERIRIKIRKELHIDDKNVIGFIGRLHYQKNPLFLIDIFYEIYKKDSNSVLIIVGDGPLKKSLQEKINEYSLQKSVFLLGVCSNVSELLQAFDLFILPSKFEGLGIVLIEAQASGLPCLTSADVVPEEAKVTDLLTYISLNDSPEAWADKGLQNIANLRENQKKNIIEKKYDIEQTVRCLEMVYFQEK